MTTVPARTRVLLAAAVIAAVLGIAVAWLALRDGPKEHMAAYVAELHSRGEPASLVEMDAPLPRADDNGAHELEIAYLIEGVPQDQEMHFSVEFNLAGLPSHARRVIASSATSIAASS